MRLAGILGVAALALVGCASSDPTSVTGHYQVRVDTPMYRYGPAQTFGPDFTLKQGQHIVLMRREYGYSRVMTDEGQSGYVATEDIVESAAPKIAQGNTNLYPGLPTNWQGRPVVPGDGRQGRFTGPVLPEGPLFGSKDLPPLPDHDGAVPKPEFRFPKPKPGFRVNIPTRETAPDEKPAN